MLLLSLQNLYERKASPANSRAQQKEDVPILTHPPHHAVITTALNHF